jgi:hypothetical protein
VEAFERRPEAEPLLRPRVELAGDGAALLLTQPFHARPLR